MLSRLTRDNFIESIHDPNRSDIVLDGLAKDITPFAEDVTKDNVGEKLFDLLKRGLEELIDPALENTRREQEAHYKSNQLKGQYGSGLLDDCNSTCSMPGCSHHLQNLLMTEEAPPIMRFLSSMKRKYLLSQISVPFVMIALNSIF